MDVIYKKNKKWKNIIVINLLNKMEKFKVTFFKIYNKKIQNLMINNNQNNKINQM